MRNHNLQTHEFTSNNFNSFPSINCESIDEQLKMVLSNKFTTHSSKWKMVGLMFYSIHKKTQKLNHDLNRLIITLVKNTQDSNFIVPEKIFESKKLSHMKIDIENANTEDMVYSLIVDNMYLRDRTYKTIDYAIEINDKRSVELLESIIVKFEDNRVKLSKIIDKLG